MGKVIGFTSSSSYTDINADVINTSVYEIRAYDKKFNQAGSTIINVTKS